MTNKHGRRLAACAVVVGLVYSSTTALAAPALAESTRLTPPQGTITLLNGRGADSWLDQFTRAKEVAFADTHWNWTAWNDSTPVTDGAAQPNYQCAEFVARSMAAAGLIPGLSPDAPQSDYFTYTAPNGKVYDLLLISPLPQYNNIYAYLMDSGIGTDLGDDPSAAQPGDFVVTYLGPNNTASHMGLVATGPTTTAEGTVDAHNYARLHFGYHYYAPSHLIKLAPDALMRVLAWAGHYGYQGPGISPANPVGPRGLVGSRFSDPAGPQV